MEQIFASCFYFLGVSCVLGVVGSFLGISIESNNKQRRLDAFNSIELSMTYNNVCKIIGETGLLVEERSIYSSKGKQVMYIWYLGWHISSKGTSVSRHTIYNNSNSGYSSGNGKISTNNKERSYIQVVFENDKVISKKQCGLGL